MADGTAALVVALSAQLTKFEKDIGKATGIADRGAKQIEDRFSKINPNASGFMTAFGASMLGAVASGLALEQVITKIRRAVGEVDDLGDMAERIGMSTNAIQALRHTMGQAGGDASLADRAFDKFTDTMAEAALGAGYLLKVFNANGVALRDSSGKMRENEALLIDFARLVSNAGSAQEKLKLSTDAFGRQAGPKMVGMLEEINTKGLPALIQAAKGVGVVLDEALIAKAGELDKAFRKVEERSATAFKKMAVDWGGPFLLETFKGLEQAVKMFALSFELISSGRVREALGLVSQFEAAKQRLAVGAGSQMTPDDATSFYDAVGMKPPLKITVGPKTKLPSAKEGKKDQLQREIESTQKRIAVLDAETATIDLNTFAREKARKVAELETAAKQANKEAGLGATVVTAAQRVQIDALSDAYARSKVAAEAAHAPLLSFAREARDTNKLLQDAAVTGLKSFEDALLGIVTGATTAKDAFKTMANAIISDLARMAIRQAITGPIAGMLGGSIGSAFLPGASLLGGSPTGLAGGTDNWRGGPTWVGEHGPEILNLPRGSQVIPNDVARRSAGGGVNVSPVFNVDASGADSAAIARLERALARTAASIRPMAVAAVSEHATRAA